MCELGTQVGYYDDHHNNGVNSKVQTINNYNIKNFATMTDNFIYVVIVAKYKLSDAHSKTAQVVSVLREWNVQLEVIRS